jgi:hypothetical protein
MSRHPSTEELSEYTEGVLKSRKAVKVSSHLDTGCTRCHGQIEELHQVTTFLTRTSVRFGPMPDQLLTRVETALASESEARVTSAPVSGEASRRDLPARGQQQRRRGWRRLPGFNSPLAGSLAAVGAAVVIAGGGYEIATNLGSAGPSATSATNAPAAHAAPGVSPVSGSANVAGVPVRFGPEVPFQHAGHQDSIHSVQTGTNFTAATLVAEARRVLAAVRESNLKLSNQAITSPYASPATASAIARANQLRMCVRKVAAGQNVLLVDVAKYQGKAATIIIVGTEPDGPGVIYAAGPGCSAVSTDILGKQDLPRP